MSQIHTREAVRAAVERALNLDPDREAAIASVAQAIGLSAEAVVECLEQQEAQAA